MNPDKQISIGEVQYFFRLRAPGETEAFALAMLSVYSPPDQALLNVSHGALKACTYFGQENLMVVDARSIISVVGMIPFPVLGEGGVCAEACAQTQGKYFLYEKITLDTGSPSEEEEDTSQVETVAH
jgi:hypothetical protein